MSRARGLCWRGETLPALPMFDDHAAIGRISRSIRGRFTAALAPRLKVAAAAARRAGLDVEPSPFHWASYTRRYGAIYWLPAAWSQPLLDMTPDTEELDAIAAWLDGSAWTARLFNAAVATVLSSPRHRLVLADDFVPPHGFQAVDANTIVVRREDDRAPEQALADARHRYDLHDFAHLATAALSSSLYGVKYHDANAMPALLAAGFPALVALVAGFKSALRPEHSDGRIFSYLLTPLFEDTDWSDAGEDEIVGRMARDLAAYLLGRGRLIHLQDGPVQVAEPVTPVELAVLAQQKLYEWPASEIEQHLFVRGGVDGRDPFEGPSASQRLAAFADIYAAGRRTHHERRNTLKHRAHTDAYRLVARDLLARDGLARHERELVALVLDRLSPKDGHGKSLFVE